MSVSVKLGIPPGVDNEDPDYTKPPKWVDCDKIRFRKNYPEKIGGWTKYSLEAAEGITRGYKTWRDNSYNLYSGLGTNKKFYIESGGYLTDVTPLRASGTLGANPITTTISSANVSISHTSHGLTKDDIIILDNATAVGGITVDGEYTVVSITDANTYVITHTSAATSSATGGGAAVTYEYLIPVGRETTVFGLGYGAGTYSSGYYGDPATSSGIAFTARTWSINNWGEDLVINPRGGSIYLWDASAGLTANRASVIAAAPAAHAVLVSPVDRHMAAFGCEATTGSGIIDPLLIRWSDQGDYTDWTPSATNTSGTKKLQSGSEIVSAVIARGEFLVFTDTSVTSMRYTGTDFVFSFDDVGTNCGLIGPQAVINHGATTYWMSQGNFYIYDGTLRPLPTTVHHHVFNDINLVQSAKFFAGLNSLHQEVWFFYCSANSDEIDKYVIYNYENNIWYYGTMARTAWTDSSVLANPTGVGTDGYIYLHENGVDDDTNAMSAYIETGEFEFPETDQSGPGDYMTFLHKVIPDLRLTGSVDLYIKTRRYPSDSAEITKGPYNITPTTEKVDFRARGRQWAIRWSSDDKGDDWRLGDHRFYIRPQGRR